MRITENTLREQETVVDRLEIRPVGGMYYLARIWIDQQLHLLSDEAGKTRLFTTTYALRKALKGVEWRECLLQDQSAFDEMVGLGPSAPEGLTLRLGEVE
ncbi:DUF6482 family protein [Marinobacteraceae bacterium S3BR75-40.1]